MTFLVAVKLTARLPADIAAFESAVSLWSADALQVVTLIISAGRLIVWVNMHLAPLREPLLRVGVVPVYTALHEMSRQRGV